MIVLSSRSLFFATAAVLAALQIRAAVITESVLPFGERDRYFSPGSGVLARGSSGRPVLNWKKGCREMTVRYFSLPGIKPLQGADSYEVLTSRGNGKVKVVFTCLGDGKKSSFEADWKDGRAEFYAGLDHEKKYLFTEMVFSSDAMPPGPLEINALAGRSRVPQAEALRMEVDTGTAYHALAPSSKPVFRLRNISDAKVHWRGKIILRDFFGEGFDVPVDVSVGGNAEVEVPSPTPMPGKGIWHVAAEVSGSDGSSSASQKTTFAVLDERKAAPAPGYGKFRMGTVCHIEYIPDQDREVCCRAMAAMGATLVRCNLCMMGLVQPKGPDHFDFSLQDKMIAMFSKYGLALDTILTWAPRWSLDEKRKALADKHGIGVMTPESGPFRRYCETLARRYGTKIAYYETSNEVDARDPECGNIDELIAFQRAGWEGVKKGCPEAKVLTPGFGALSSDHPAIKMPYCQERICSEARDAYDVHAVHGHGPFGQYVARVEKMLAWRKERGVSDKPWFPNETAITSCLGQDVEAAETVWKKILYSRSKGAVDYCWYNLRAKGWDDNDHEAGYGMMTADFHPRSSYCSFSALAALVGECLDTERLESDADRYMIRLKTSTSGEKQVLAFWDENVVDSPLVVKVGTDARKVFAVDLMGNCREVQFVGGVVEAALLRRPSALVFEGATYIVPDSAALKAKGGIGEEPLYVIDRDLNTKAPPDMKFDSYSMVHDIYEAQPGCQHRLWKGAGDLSAKVWFGRRTRMPYYIPVAIEVGVDVRDDRHILAEKGHSVTSGDSLSLALAFPGQKGVWALTVADSGAGVARCEFKCVPEGVAASEAVKAVSATVERHGDATRYRVQIPLSVLKASWKSDFCKGFRFNVLVGDNDGDGVDSLMEARRGSFKANDPSRFPLVVFGRKKH